MKRFEALSDADISWTPLENKAQFFKSILMRNSLFPRSRKHNESSESGFHFVLFVRFV